MTTPRSIEVRLTEYRDSLLSVADQMDEVAARVTAARVPGSDTAPLTEGARLYRIIAEDITKVIAGEELRPWAVTGVIPE